VGWLGAGGELAALHTKPVAGASGLPLFIGLAGSLIFLLKSKQVTRERKIFFWILLIPLVSIGFRVAEAVLHWK
jgi:hypothetical protein